jgi:hypothetical protein
MKQARMVRISCYLLAVLFIIGWLFCLLWVVSSSSMAFADCNGTYSLDAENARCRQPPLAGLLGLASFLVAVILVVIGRKSRS